MTGLERSINNAKAEYINADGFGIVRFGKFRGCRSLDLTNARGFAIFYTKKEAAQEIKKMGGWTSNNISRFHTRFSCGWVVGQQIGDEYRLVTDKSITGVDFADYKLDLQRAG